MTMFLPFGVAAAAALLVACGGSDDSVRGELIDPPAVVTHPHGRTRSTPPPQPAACTRPQQGQV